MLVACDLHVDDFVLDLLDDGLLVDLGVDLLEGDDLAGEGSAGGFVEAEEDLAESALAQLECLAEVDLLVLLYLAQLQLLAQFFHHNYSLSVFHRHHAPVEHSCSITCLDEGYPLISIAAPTLCW
jgi:hypothetical protein